MGAALTLLLGLLLLWIVATGRASEVLAAILKGSKLARGSATNTTRTSGRGDL